MKWHYITYLLNSIHDEKQSPQLRLRSIASSLARGAEKKDNASDDLDSFLNCEVFFMLSLRYQESTLDHNKIYGVYAVLRKAGIEIPEPDYTKPVEDVARELTWAVILSGKRLDLITSEASGDKSPTWVPDYVSSSREPSDPGSADRYQVETLGRLSPDLSYYHDASLGSRAYIAKGHPPNETSCQGKADRHYPLQFCLSNDPYQG
ncbi:hypothetical protein PG987_007298 [Apiospora arundinis]